MRQYIAVIKVAFQNSAAYKIKLFFYSLTGIIQFIIYRSIWDSVYLDVKDYNGFSQESILIYFVLSFVIQSLLPRWIAMEIGWGVKKGDIIHNLLKPIKFKQYYFNYSFGDVIFTFIFMGIPIIILSIFTSSMVGCQDLFGFIFSVTMAYIIVFHIFYMIGLLSFWLTNIWGIFITFDFVYLFFSGAYLPLQLMPKWLKIISEILPFKYIIGFPISRWLDSSVDIMGFSIQLIWVILLTIASNLIYKKAKKKVEIFGG